MRHGWMGFGIAASLLAGCALIDPAEDRPASFDRTSPHAPQVTGREHVRERGTVLSALQGRVAGMHVNRAGGCPEITLRGRTSIMGSSNPVIYVDGTRVTNTCILEMLNSNDVDRVEVYPMGIAPGGSHRNSPTGLILIFLRTAET
jgi:hypothetical protein